MEARLREPFCFAEFVVIRHEISKSFYLCENIDYSYKNGKTKDRDALRSGWIRA